MTGKNQHGFAHIIIIVSTIVVLGAAAGTGYYVWHRNHTDSQSPATKNTSSSGQQHNQPVSKVTNYDECTKAPGSILLQTYPTVCKTKDGQSFTQSAQTPQPTPKYLTITEWGVRAPYTASDTFSYKLSADGSVATIISKSLADNYGCTGTNGLPSGAGSISRYKGTDSATHIDSVLGEGKTVSQYVASMKPITYPHIGDYYYFYAQDQAACSSKAEVGSPGETAASTVSREVVSLVANLQAL